MIPSVTVIQLHDENGKSLISNSILNKDEFEEQLSTYISDIEHYFNRPKILLFQNILIKEYYEQFIFQSKLKDVPKKFYPIKSLLNKTL